MENKILSEFLEWVIIIILSVSLLMLSQRFGQCLPTLAFISYMSTRLKKNKSM